MASYDFRRTASVDASLWDLERMYGVAGGADQVVLTEQGRERAFEQGAHVAGRAATALRLLSAEGGRWSLLVRRGSRIEPGPAFDYNWEWKDLRRHGYVETDYGDSGETIVLTAAGTRAYERGVEEMEVLRRKCEDAAESLGLTFLRHR